MIDEYWGTLSLFDHRTHVLVKSLFLFDRVVVPIPNRPIHDLNAKELDELHADASYLEKNDAAIIYKWNQNEFDGWRDNYLKESLARKSSDLLYDSRLMLAERSEEIKPKGVYDVTAVPVYAAREEFAHAYTTLGNNGQQLMIELSQLIDIPVVNTPLQYIVELRNKESFQSAKRALRKWQEKTMPELLTEKSAKNLALAGEDFRRMLKRYEEEIGKGNFKTSKVVITSLLAMGSLFAAATGHPGTALGLISGTVPNLFALKEASVPLWKSIRDQSFEAAGVIYEANLVLKSAR